MRLWSDGKLRKHVGSTAPVDYTLSTITANDPLVATNNNELDSCYIGGNRMLLVYESGTALKGVIISNMDTTPQYGTPFNIFTGITVKHPSVCYADGDTAFVACVDDANGALKATAITTLSGTPTPGALLTGLPSIQYWQPIVRAFASGRVLLITRDMTNSPNKIRGWVINDVLTTPAAGSEITGFPNVSAYYLSMIIMESDKAMVSFDDASYSAVRAVIISNLSTSPTIGAPLVIHGSGTTGDGGRLVYMGAGKALYVFPNGQSPYYLYFYPLIDLLTSPAIGNQSPSYGGTYSGTSGVHVVRTGDSSVMILHRQTISTRVLHRLSNVFGTPSQAADISIPLDVGSYSAMKVNTGLEPLGIGGSGDGSVLLSFGGSSYLTSQRFSATGVVDSGDRYLAYFAGAADAVTLAQKLNATNYVKYTSNGVSFSAGAPVYIGTNSIIQSSANGAPIGMAINSTEILVKKP